MLGVSFYVLESYTISNAKSPKRQASGDILFGVSLFNFNYFYLQNQSAAIHGSAHLVLKEGGVCTVRRLPCHYDLNFWKKV